MKPWARNGRLRRWTFVRAALVPAALVSLLGGCTVGPDFAQPKPWWSPASWGQHEVKPVVASSKPVVAAVDPAWWNQFHDAEMTALEGRLVESNLDLRIAMIRLGESRAAYGQARAAMFPTLNANGSYTRELISPNGIVSAFGAGAPGGSFTAQSGIASGLVGTQAGTVIPNTTGVIPPFNLYQYGFDATWEIDLWGRVRRGVEAAQASVDAANDQLRDTLVAIEAELARDYIQLRGVQRTRQIIEENLASARESLKLTQERATTGLTTDLDVANAQAQADGIAAQLPQLEQQEAQLINAVSQLLGQPPQALAGDLRPAKPIPPVPPQIPVGLPSDLARRRPDIRAAEAQLHAATAQIGVAVASFFPSISLSGSFGFQSVTTNNIFNWNSQQYGFGPTVVLPIFQGGQLVSTLELRKQQEKEAAVAYQRTVLAALHDVDNALTAYDAEQKRNQRLATETAAARRALELARARYVQGISTFLDVLEAQRVVLAAEQQLADSTTTVSTNLVALYKSLGGGWESAYPLPDTTAKAAPVTPVKGG